eukprot:5157801-Alexandrium_andersonii.AAC.1
MGGWETKGREEGGRVGGGRLLCFADSPSVNGEPLCVHRHIIGENPRWESGGRASGEGYREREREKVVVVVCAIV